MNVAPLVLDEENYALLDKRCRRLLGGSTYDQHLDAVSNTLEEMRSQGEKAVVATFLADMLDDLVREGEDPTEALIYLLTRAETFECEGDAEDALDQLDYLEEFRDVDRELVDLALSFENSDEKAFEAQAILAAVTEYDSPPEWCVRVDASLGKHTFVEYSGPDDHGIAASMAIAVALQGSGQITLYRPTSDIHPLLGKPVEEVYSWRVRAGELHPEAKDTIPPVFLRDVTGAAQPRDAFDVDAVLDDMAR